jgi:rubrerythrin
MTKDDELQLERMIEIIVRSIPKEEAQAKLYRETAQKARREMNRMLFEKLASQGEEHAQKLRATMDILQKELGKLRAAGGKVEPDPATCMPTHEFNVNIRQTMRIARDMKKLAEKGLADANDPSCRAMYETMLNMSGELRGLAEDEVEGHILKDKWD